MDCVVAKNTYALIPHLKIPEKGFSNRKCAALCATSFHVDFEFWNIFSCGRMIVFLDSNCADDVHRMSNVGIFFFTKNASVQKLYKQKTDENVPDFGFMNKNKTYKNQFPFHFGIEASK